MLTIYKEAGYTSSDAVARLRGILRMRKIGHTGTLDPDAQGVLPMCLGNATRICELIADREKEYVAVMRLGIKTDTQDMSGNVLFRMEDGEMLSRLSTEERIRSAAASFVGEIDQVPPMYSAVKINGKRLYDMARKGITVERKPRRITIYSIRVEKIEPPLVTMRIWEQELPCSLFSVPGSDSFSWERPGRLMKSSGSRRPRRKSSPS